MTHGFLQLSLGSVVIPGIWSIKKKHHLRQMNEDRVGTREIKKSLDDILAYIKFEGESV